MSLLKRLSTTFVSRIDAVVGEIENHHAVIQATLTDMRKKVAEARVRLGQVHREEARLKQRMQTQEENACLWQKRALEAASHDESKALDCIQRSRQCQREQVRLEQVIQQYQQTAARLAGDIESSELRLAEMKQKATLLRARQSANSARSITSNVDNVKVDLMDDTFERWEINVSQAEMALETYDAIDPLEQEFVKQEESEDLRAELAELLAKEKEALI